MKHRKLKNSELDRLSPETFKIQPKTPLVLVLDNIRSLNNIGAVFRTSDAFLIQKIFLCGITAKPPHKDIRKTALGATETVHWEHVESTLEAVNRLKEENYEVWAIEQTENATQLQEFQPSNKPQAFIFGNEVKGVQQKVIDVCDGVLEIPQFGTKHSLNISVSVGVVVWDYFSKKNN